MQNNQLEICSNAESGSEGLWCSQGSVSNVLSGDAAATNLGTCIQVLLPGQMKWESWKESKQGKDTTVS